MTFKLRGQNSHLCLFDPGLNPEFENPGFESQALCGVFSWVSSFSPSLEPYTCATSPIWLFKLYSMDMRHFYSCRIKTKSTRILFCFPVNRIIEEKESLRTPATKSYDGLVLEVSFKKLRNIVSKCLYHATTRIISIFF